MNKREILKRIIENWFVEKTSIRPTKDGLNSLVDRIHYNKQLTLTDVVSTSCDKCDNTGVLWSKDRLSAKTCGCK